MLVLLWINSIILCALLVKFAVSYLYTITDVRCNVHFSLGYVSRAVLYISLSKVLLFMKKLGLGLAQCVRRRDCSQKVMSFILTGSIRAYY